MSRSNFAEGDVLEQHTTGDMWRIEDKSRDGNIVLHEQDVKGHDLERTMELPDTGDLHAMFSVVRGAYGEQRPSPNRAT